MLCSTHQANNQVTYPRLAAVVCPSLLKMPSLFLAPNLVALVNSPVVSHHNKEAEVVLALNNFHPTWAMVCQVNSLRLVHTANRVTLNSSKLCNKPKLLLPSLVVVEDLVLVGHYKAFQVCQVCHPWGSKVLVNQACQASHKVLDKVVCPVVVVVLKEVAHSSSQVASLLKVAVFPACLKVRMQLLDSQLSKPKYHQFSHNSRSSFWERLSSLRSKSFNQSWQARSPVCFWRWTTLS